MSLYICHECKETFDLPMLETYQGETWATCPRCGSADFVDTWQCESCGKDAEWDDLIAGVYCPDCVEEAKKDKGLIEEFLAFDDVKESFAEYLAERKWKRR